MPADAPNVLALDFDGVLCDGLVEYFQTSWRTYCQIWNPDSPTPPEELASSFYRLRPVIERGLEMPILLRALMLGVSEKKIWQDWSTVAQQVVESQQCDHKAIGKKLDAIRDDWIATDLENWLDLHQFYPGVVERVKSLLADATTQLYIVTTKEGRFASQLLQREGISLPLQTVIGKEYQRPKHETLGEIAAASGEAVSLWFVEDRLETLQVVQQHLDSPALRLFLADWGYNTEQMRVSVRDESRIKLLSLDQFNQDFSAWLLH
jgi:phosphoglycolate phosphatase-like HAD superfamily hydrolase